MGYFVQFLGITETRKFIMRQVAKVFMVALFATAVWTSSAKAEPSFFTVKVDLVGQATPGSLGFRFTDTAAVPDFTFARFSHTGGLKKEFLAIALTARSLDATLFVYTDPDDGVAPEILQMFLRD